MLQIGARIRQSGLAPGQFDQHFEPAQWALLQLQCTAPYIDNIAHDAQPKALASGLFIQAVDPLRQWFAYHPLFASFIGAAKERSRLV